LIELILVMTILAIAVSFTAPALAHFFRGRSLDSEAGRLLALTRQGQSRAVSEGVPVDLWFDVSRNAYGLEAEASFEPNDPKAVSIGMDPNIRLEVLDLGQGDTALPGLFDENATAPQGSGHAHLPRIRFLPDGSVTETSPRRIHLVLQDETSLWLVLANTRLNYEIQTRKP
jgi:type II secretory pathway pseudopilin PulG